MVVGDYYYSPYAVNCSGTSLAPERNSRRVKGSFEMTDRMTDRIVGSCPLLSLDLFVCLSVYFFGFFFSFLLGVGGGARGGAE